MTKNLEKILEKFKAAGIKRASEATKYEFFSTPFPTVTNLIGGIPRGRFTTIAGPEHTGKGAFCAQLVAYLQNQDPNFICLWTDAENAFDEEWAKKLGIDLDRLILQKYNPSAMMMERLLDDALELVKEAKIDLWIVDSIGALVPKNDVYESKGKVLINKSLESTNMLNLQRKLGEFYRKANIIISPEGDYKGCAVVMIGQVKSISLAA